MGPFLKYRMRYFSRIGIGHLHQAQTVRRMRSDRSASHGSDPSICHSYECVWTGQSECSKCSNRKMLRSRVEMLRCRRNRVLPKTPDAGPSEVTPSVLFGPSNIVTRCHTNFQMRKILFEWTIENFSLRYERALKSSTFSEGVNKEKWYLVIDFEDEEMDEELYEELDEEMDEKSKDLPLYLGFIPCREDQVVNAKAKFSILNAKKEEKEIWISDTIKFTSRRLLRITEFVRRGFLLNEVNGLLPDDKLTILCEIRVLDNVISSNDPVTIPIEPDNVGLSLFENPEFSDITVLVDGREIQAHKAILATQSRVFSTMLKSEMSEKQTNYVKIEDIDYETAREMLRFIYTGKVENLGKTRDLLFAAEKYELTKLKVMCEKILCTQLTVENVAEILILAELYRADYLKAQALYIIKIHLTDVLNTVGYKSLANSHPHLVLETLQAVANIVRPGNK